LIYSISWNATFQTTVEAFPTDAYIANVSAALGVPASSVSVSVSAGSVVVTTRVSAGQSATEAARLTSTVPELCITDPLTMGDSCTPPVVDVETIFGPASITGDPHFYGADGDRIDFKGKDNTVYNLLSAYGLALNALFTHVTFFMGGMCERCSRKTVHGSFMKVAYFRARTSTGTMLTVEYKADEPSHAALTTSGAGEEALPFATEGDITVSQKMPDTIEHKQDDVSVTLTRKHAREAAVAVRNGDFEVTAASRYLGYAEQNKYMKRLDVSIKPLKDVARSEVAPHGLLGQTFDGDGVAVDGALDDYSANVVYTKALGEGAIEGQAADYELPPNAPFSSVFKYTRFDAHAAPPRDTSKLNGVRRQVGRPESPAAGSEGDDVAAVAATAATA